MNNPDHISESLETIFCGLKYFNYLMRIGDLGKFAFATLNTTRTYIPLIPPLAPGRANGCRILEVLEEWPVHSLHV
jgi:hypothetical protein